MKQKINEVEDLANLLLYRLKNSNNCELTQEVVDRFREIVRKLLLENRILKEDSEFKPWIIIK